MIRNPNKDPRFLNQVLIVGKPLNRKNALFQTSEVLLYSGKRTLLEALTFKHLKYCFPLGTHLETLNFTKP